MYRRELNNLEGQYQRRLEENCEEETLHFFNLSDNFNFFVFNKNIENVIGWRLRNIYASASDPSIVREVVVYCSALSAFKWQSNTLNGQESPFIYAGNMQNFILGPHVRVNGEKLSTLTQLSFNLAKYNPGAEPSPYWDEEEEDSVHYDIRIEIGIVIKK